MPKSIGTKTLDAKKAPSQNFCKYGFVTNERNSKLAPLKISENKRKEHNQTPKEIYGPADEITVELVISLCNKHKIN